jgi:peptidoglycan/LPS O-acetylase OafA/YrhL
VRGVGASTLAVVIVASPTTVRQAGAVVALEGVAALLVAVVLVVRHLSGTEDPPWLSGYGTALWFAIMGAAVLAAGWALWTGRRWGRGLAVFAQLLLLPVAWYMAVDSQQWGYGVPIGVVAVVVLALLFSPSALQWVAQASGAAPSASEASADSSDPDTR